MCGSRYCWRAQEGLGRACSLRWSSARAVRARTRHHNRSGPHKRPAAAPCKPRACRAPAAAALAMPVTSWTFTAGIAKSLPSKSSITCVQEGREVKVSAVRRAAGALQEAKCTRAAHTGRPSEVWGTGLRWRRGSPHVSRVTVRAVTSGPKAECEESPELARRSVPSVPTPPAARSRPPCFLL